VTCFGMLNDRYSPIDEVFQRTIFRPETAVQLLVLVPPFIAAMLAMLLSAFRGQNVMDITTILSSVLVVRQYLFGASALFARQMGLLFGAGAAGMLAGKLVLRLWKKKQLSSRSAKVAEAGLSI
jgi:hypothetical protein